MPNIYEEMLSMPENNEIINSDADIIIPAVNANEGEISISTTCDPFSSNYDVNDNSDAEVIVENKIEA